MTGLLQKLVLGGYAKMQVINFSLQEMILPQQQGTTKIIYEWSQYWRDAGALDDEEFTPYIQLLCTIQDRSQNLHFMTQGLWQPKAALTNENVYSHKDTHSMLFTSDQDICLTFGAFRQILSDNLINPGTIPYTFNRPIGLNNQVIPRTLQRTNLPAPNEYDYKPGNAYQDEMGYDSGFNPIQGYAETYTAVVKYLDVNLSMDELQKLICTMI